MVTHKLTTTLIERYTPKRDDERLADGDGLYLRVRQNRSGQVSKTWMFTYKNGTRSSYLMLGDYLAPLPAFDIALFGLEKGAVLSLANARKIRAELIGCRKRSEDPKEYIANEVNRQQLELARMEAEQETARLAEAAAEEERRRNSLTLRDMYRAWLADGVRRKDGNKALCRILDANVMPFIGDRLVRDVSEHDLRKVLRPMVERGANRSAVMVRNDLAQMFKWAEKRQPWRKLLIEGNPVDLIEIGKIVAPEFDMDYVRTRVLTSAEIRELNAILDGMHMDYECAANRRLASQPLERTTQHAIWIMLSTMCRVGELMMARWEHVDCHSGVWFIPKANVKDNVADLVVHMSAFTLRHFRALQDLTGHTDWCFPSWDGKTPISAKTITKQLGDRQSRFKKSRDGGPRKPMKNRRHDDSLVLSNGAMGAWTAHDLRRTGATLMQKLGVSLETIDRCQNHVLPGSRVRRHYLHYDYAEEKQQAWALLGRHLELILAGLDVSAKPGSIDRKSR